VHPSQHRKALFWRPPLAHHRFDSASLLPRKERGVHGETFDLMSFKFGATWRERYFAWLVWAGNPSPLPFHRTCLIACRPLDLRGILCLLLLDPRSRAFHCHHKGRRLEPLHGTNFTLLDVSCLSGDLGQPGEGRTKEEKQWNKSLMDQDWSPPSGLTLKCLCLFFDRLPFRAKFILDHCKGI